MESAEPKEPYRLPEGRLQGMHAFIDLVRQALGCAAQKRWNDLILSDPIQTLPTGPWVNVW